MEEKVLFDDDQKKINDAVRLHAMGSYQIGEVAKLSALLYDRGIDVIQQLKALHRKYNV